MTAESKGGWGGWALTPLRQVTDEKQPLATSLKNVLINGSSSLRENLIIPHIADLPIVAQQWR